MNFIKKHQSFFVALIISYLLLVVTYAVTSVGIAKYTFFLQMRAIYLVL